MSQYWQEFKAALLSIKSKKAETAKFGFLDFTDWVESKIQQRPMRELMEEKIRAKWYKAAPSQKEEGGLQLPSPRISGRETTLSDYSKIGA